jgi:Fe-S cluster assembly protein SufD
LLSRTAEIDTRPELDVHADNVKAGHGASVGQIDPEEMFYFLCRGIRKEIAAQMLAEGFVREALGDLTQQSFYAPLWSSISAELARVSAEAGGVR